MSRPIRYEIEFNWLTTGKPPNVYVSEVFLDRFGNERLGGQVVEVFEEPTPRGDLCSKYPNDWEPGPIAKKILQILNS